MAGARAECGLKVMKVPPFRGHSVKAKTILGWPLVQAGLFRYTGETKPARGCPGVSSVAECSRGRVKGEVAHGVFQRIAGIRIWWRFSLRGPGDFTAAT